jgi:hypothetical protein
MHNTLVNRCVIAYVEGAGMNLQPIARRQGVRAVIEHIAAELTVLDQQSNSTMSAHDAAAWLLAQLAHHT